MAVILTVADEAYISKWGFCIESQDAYALKHGWDRVLHKDPIGDLNMKWSKLARAADLLRSGADGLMLIDADAEIVADAPRFTDVMNQYDAEIFYVLGVSGRANSGVLMLRGQGGIQLMEDCLAGRNTPVEKKHVVSVEGENGHIIALLEKPEMKAVSQVLPLAWNCTQPDHAAKAYVLHYTNLLRKAWASGAFKRG